MQTPLQQYLHAEAHFNSIGARFLLAAGRSYPAPFGQHGFKRGAQGACYRNAFDLARKHPELTYCEGRALSMGMVPIEHAWCVDGAGQVIDTTWEPAEQSYHGVCFRMDWLELFLAKRTRYGVLAEQFAVELAQIEPESYLHEPSEHELASTRTVLADVRSILSRKEPA